MDFWGKSKIINLVFIAAIVLIITQIISYFSCASAHADCQVNQRLIFGLVGNNQIAIITYFIIIPITLLIFRHFGSLPLSLITGGALGNLYQRILYGGVVDYLDFYGWPLFNFADMAIVAGAICLVGQIIIFYKKIPASRDSKP